MTYISFEKLSPCALKQICVCHFVALQNTGARHIIICVVCILIYYFIYSKNVFQVSPNKQL